MIEIPDAPWVKNAMLTGYEQPWELDDGDGDQWPYKPEWEPEMEWEHDNWD